MSLESQCTRGLLESAKAPAIRRNWVGPELAARVGCLGMLNTGSFDVATRYRLVLIFVFFQGDGNPSPTEVLGC